LNQYPALSGYVLMHVFHLFGIWVTFLYHDININ